MKKREEEERRKQEEAKRKRSEEGWKKNKYDIDKEDMSRKRDKDSQGKRGKMKTPIQKKTHCHQTTCSTTEDPHETIKEGNKQDYPEEMTTTSFPMVKKNK
jgi:hypothetical protein